MNKSFIPEQEATFYPWQSNLMSNIVSRAPALGVPLDRVAEVQALQSRWEAAYAITQNPATCTKGAVKEKQEARKAYVAALRGLVRSFLTYNPLLSDKDREDMGLPVHKKTHTAAPVADKAPYITVSGDGAKKDSAAKPDGQQGAEVASVISDTKPAEIEDLTHSSFDTHSPLILTFKESERGKTLWFAARWENTRGEKGPWSEIESTIVP